MRVCLMLIATLTISLFAAGQAVVTGSNWATTQGVTVVPAPTSSPLLVTPIVHLGTPPMQVGATNATSGSAPAPAPMVPEVVMPSTLVIPAPAVVTTPQATGQAAASPKVLDRGVARFNDSIYRIGESQRDRRSLGEMAREVRQRKGTTTARLYTNDDIARLNQQSGVTMMPGAQPSPSNLPNTSGILPQQAPPAHAH